MSSREAFRSRCVSRRVCRSALSALALLAAGLASTTRAQAELLVVGIDRKFTYIEADFYKTWRTSKDFCGGVGLVPADAAADGLMNPGPVIEGDPVEGELPPGDEDGELDADTAAPAP